MRLSFSLFFACIVSVLTWSRCLAAPQCVTWSIAEPQLRGTDLSVGPDILAFGTAGDAFANPARDGELRVYRPSSSQPPELLASLPLPPSSGIAIVRSEDFLTVGLPGARTGSTDSTPDIGILQRGVAPWAQAASVEMAGLVLVWRQGRVNEDPLRLESTHPERFAQFGAAVAVYGTRVAVGAPGEGGHGVVYVFDLDQPASEPQRLIAPAGAEEFGSSVAFSFGRLYVGAPGPAGQCCGGFVFPFEATPEGWRVGTPIVNPVAATQVSYGQSVLSGPGGLIVAGNGIDLGDGAPEAGAIDVFVDPGPLQSSSVRLLPRGAKPGSPFGFAGAVVVAGERIVVNERTSVLVFSRAGDAWPESRRIHASELSVATVQEIAADRTWLAYREFAPAANYRSGQWKVCVVPFP